MALLAKHGEIEPMPDAAIFADTQNEPQSVYKWLDWLEAQLPFPVHRVTRGDLATKALQMRKTKDGRLFTKTDIPFWTRNHDGSLGRIKHRACTADYKIHPIRQKAKELAEIKRGTKEVQVTQWIGISLDEAQRMKPAREPWWVNRWPLIDLRMRREDCLHWMEQHGYPRPPRSSCVFCPFHSNGEWRKLQLDDPDAFQDAVTFEQMIQKVKAQSENFRTTPFLHRSCIPLDQIDFRTDLEHGQGLLWGNECEGMCGV